MYKTGVQHPLRIQREDSSFVTKALLCFLPLSFPVLHAIELYVEEEF
jgi:hypothetical protein